MSDVKRETPLRTLIEGHLRGRSWNKLGEALGVSGAAVRGWANGDTPLPEFRAEGIAEFLGVSANAVREAAGLPTRDEGVSDEPPTSGVDRDGLLASAYALHLRTTGSGLERLTNAQLADLIRHAVQGAGHDA